MSIKTIMLVRKILAAEDRVVTYRPDGHTLCPVCQFLGLPPGKVIAHKTSGEIRYCRCEQCEADFRAFGPTATELKEAREKGKQTEIAQEKAVKDSKKAKQAAKKKTKEKQRRH
ncbi:MAG TPA: hypothetical protein PLM07_20915 [Candidatus Rifleibacterium sp.]|nr:hypothetical protein [Candidatus Rifleibacterium sp.]